MINWLPNQFAMQVHRVHMNVHLTKNQVICILALNYFAHVKSIEATSFGFQFDSQIQNLNNAKYIIFTDGIEYLP